MGLSLPLIFKYQNRPNKSRLCSSPLLSGGGFGISCSARCSHHRDEIIEREQRGHISFDVLIFYLCMVGGEKEIHEVLMCPFLQETKRQYYRDLRRQVEEKNQEREREKTRQYNEELKVSHIDTTKSGISK